MIKAIVIKELREAAFLAVLALAAYLYFVAGLMGANLPGFAEGSSYYRPIPFVSGSFQFGFVVISGLFVIGLALRQTLRDFNTERSLFLLHRPIERWHLVVCKLGTGLAIYLLISGIPLINYALWAATPGTHASPFFWSMTGSAWHMWLTMSLIYLSMFLACIRPAKWYATRLLPLIAGAVIAAFLQFMPASWVLRVLLLLAANAVVAITILTIADEKDYP